jgi:recombination protein RecA
VKEGDKVVGNRTRVKVVKNKVAPPFREAEFDIRYGVGVDRFAEAVDLATDRGILEKSGTHYALDGERIAHGRERAAEWLKANPAAFQKVAERLQAAQAAANLEPAAPPDEEAA